MICQILDKLGLFVGKAKDPNHEAWHFLHANQWIFRNASADWQTPQPVADLAAQEDMRGHIVGGLLRDLNQPKIMRYLGVQLWLQYRSVFDLALPWGWKDPRNTYTLPFWLALFPDARIVHIERHGLDVALSLAERAHALSKRPLIPTYARFLPRNDVILHLHVQHVTGGVRLWDQYMTQALAHQTALGDQMLTVRYEDILQDPMPHLDRLARHCNLPPSPQRFDGAAQGINRARAYAYRRADLPDLGEKVTQCLNKWGYN